MISNYLDFITENKLELLLEAKIVYTQQFLDAFRAFIKIVLFCNFLATLKLSIALSTKDVKIFNDPNLYSAGIVTDSLREAFTYYNNIYRFIYDKNILSLYINSIYTCPIEINDFLKIDEIFLNKLLDKYKKIQSIL